MPKELESRTWGEQIPSRALGIMLGAGAIETRPTGGPRPEGHEDDKGRPMTPALGIMTEGIGPLAIVEIPPSSGNTQGVRARIPGSELALHIGMNAQKGTKKMTACNLGHAGCNMTHDLAPTCDGCTN